MEPEDYMQQAHERIEKAKRDDPYGVDLTKLNLNSTQLASLLKKIEKDLPKLKWLILTNNNLSELPSEIGNLKNLEGLTLDDNHISEFPTEMGNLKKLESLNANNNKLSEIPTIISNFEMLQDLSLKNNTISRIPADIVKNTELVYLHLNNNNLSEVPEELVQLAILQEVNLPDNPLSQETVNFLNASFVDDIVEYNMAAHDVKSDPNEVLTKIYGKEKEAILAKIEALDTSWTFVNGHYLAEKAETDLKKIESGELEDLDGSLKRNAEEIIANNTLTAPNVLIGLLEKNTFRGL